MTPGQRFTRGLITGCILAIPLDAALLYLGWRLARLLFQ